MARYPWPSRSKPHQPRTSNPGRRAGNAAAARRIPMFRGAAASPITCLGLRVVAAQDSPPFVADHEEAVRGAEGQDRYCDEIHGGDSFTVVAKQDMLFRTLILWPPSDATKHTPL